MAKDDDLKIRNYTSVVDPEKSRRVIEALLVKAGAVEVSKMYRDKQVEGYMFRLPILNVSGAPQVVQFRMPVDVFGVERVLMKDLKTYVANYDRKAAAIKKQAVRTAWKLLADWVHLQLSMIALAQIEPLQAFMPYAYDPRTKETYYERLRAERFEVLALPAGPKNGEWKGKDGNPDVVEWRPA